MAVSRQTLLGEELDSGRYAPSVHPLTQEQTQPEGVCPEPPPPIRSGTFSIDTNGTFSTDIDNSLTSYTLTCLPTLVPCV